LKKFKHIEFLEPTAGIGNIVKHVLKLNRDIHIDMVEIQPENREILKEMVKIAPDVLNLYEQGDFLKFANQKEYDLVIMNPPYHLQKRYIPHLDRDYYDMDFVMKCFNMLKDNGELIALVKYENANKEYFKKWLDDNNADVINMMKTKWSKSKKINSEIGSINLSIIIMNRNKANLDDKKIADRDLILDNTDKFDMKVEAIKEYYTPLHETKKEEKEREKIQFDRDEKDKHDIEFVNKLYEKRMNKRFEREINERKEEKETNNILETATVGVLAGSIIDVLDSHKMHVKNINKFTKSKLINLIINKLDKYKDEIIEKIKRLTNQENIRKTKRKTNLKEDRDYWKKLFKQYKITNADGNKRQKMALLNERINHEKENLEKN
jgi:predicted RNA methylase